MRVALTKSTVLVLALSIALPLTLAAQTSEDNITPATRLSREAMELRISNRDSAEVLAMLAAVLAPDDPWVLYRASFVLELSKRHLPVAIAMARRATQLEPRNATFHAQLGSALHKAGERDEMEQELAISIELEPGGYGRYIRSWIRRIDRRWSDAEEDARIYIKGRPQSGYAHYELAYALERQNRFEEAIEAAQKAIELGYSKSATMHGMLGMSLYYLDRLDEALQELEEAVRLDPSDSYWSSRLEEARTKTMEHRPPVGRPQRFAEANAPTAGNTAGNNASQESNAAPSNTNSSQTAGNTAAQGGNTGSANANAPVGTSGTKGTAQGTTSNAVGDCRGDAFSVGKVKGYIDKVNRVTSINGRDITGTYRFENHPSGRPRVELNKDGTGIFELWGRDPAGGPGQERPMKWWLLTNCDGTPLVEVTGPGGSGYVLVVEYSSDDRKVYQLAIPHDGSRMIILGERVKR